MKKKQRKTYFSKKLALIALCFPSWVFSSDSDDLKFGEKDSKSFSPSFYGTFSSAYQDDKTTHDFHSKSSSLPCISILSDKLQDSYCKADKDHPYQKFFDAEIISWAQLPYKAKIDSNFSLEIPLSFYDYPFDPFSSQQHLAGFFTLPSQFKKRALKNLPDFLVFSLAKAADHKLTYLGVISQQPLYDPIPSEELIMKKNLDRHISKNIKILQHFDSFLEDSSFQSSNYIAQTPVENSFILPEKAVLIEIKQVPYISSFSTDPLYVDAAAFSHSEQNTQNITFIPLKEICFYLFTSNLSQIAVENETFTHVISFTELKTHPVLKEDFSLCHQDKLSYKDFYHQITAAENFLSVFNPNFLLRTSKELSYISAGPQRQPESSIPVFLASSTFSPFKKEGILSSCDFLVKSSFQDLDPSKYFTVNLSKERTLYKQGFALSSTFSFNCFASPLYLDLTIDPHYPSLAVLSEKASPLKPPQEKAYILALNTDGSDHFISLHSIYEGLPFVTESSEQALHQNKIFFEEALCLSVSPADLHDTTSFLHANLSQDMLAHLVHRNFTDEKASSLLSFISFDAPNLRESLEALASLELNFSGSFLHLDLLTLTMEDPFDLTKTYLDENIAIFEIHPSALETALPVNFHVATDVFSLPDPQNHGFEISYLLSYQKALKPRLSEYSIIVDKPLDEDKCDPILSSLPAKVQLAGFIEQHVPSRSSSIALAHIQRKISKNLEAIPDVESLNNYNATEDFIHDLHITPNPKGTGYLFSITLLPQQQKLETNCPQNYIFLIDRSGSIDKTRFQSFKQGVMKSLLYLKDCDTFNIITFDTEMNKMSHESVFATQATKHGAKRYLENQKRGYQYGIPNIPQVLLSLQPIIQKSSLPTTIVLLTSGKTLENYNKELDGPLLKKQLKANKNSFTLFTAGCQDVSDSNMLEMISLLNRGEYMISQTNAAFPRKLAALVKHATYLAASNVHITTANRSQPVKVEIYPNSPIAPNLYGDKPYTIVGKIDKLADFDLVLQGRFCDNWILIKKKVSFSNARHGGHSILKDFKTFTAYNQYHEYFEDGSLAHLEESKDSSKKL